MVLGKFKVADACAVIVSGCVDTKLGYTLLGEADRRLQEDDVRGLQTILASDGQEKRGVMLVFACVHGASRCAKYLIKQGAMSDVDMAACGDILDPVTPITIAGLLGHWEVVDALVDGGAEVYAFDRKGFSALSVAASQYPEGNLESLLRRQDTGMHINSACLQGFTPLMEASAPAVPLLVEAGANVNLETGVGTALFQACHLASLEDVKALVEHGADNRPTSGKRMTPLMVAAEKGRADIVKYLLARPTTDINAKSAEEGRAIDFACRMGHLEVVKILVGAGSRVEADTTNEWSPLVAGVVEGDLALVKYLVEEAGVDVQRPGLLCMTPLMWAQKGAHTGAVAKYLQEVISQREQLHTQQVLLAAEEQAAVARAALLEKEARAAAAAAALLEELEEEDRAMAAKEANTKKKKKKQGKKQGGATAPTVTPSPPPQEQGSSSTPEVSNTRDVTQTLAAVLASTTIDTEGMGGSREGMSKGGSSVVADADAQESDGQHVVPTGGPSEPATYKETPSEAITDSAEAGIEQALLEGLSCPISFQLMTDPVSAEDGHTYEQAAIQQWIDKCRADKRELTSPLTGAPMGTGLRPNLLVRSFIRNLVRSNIHGT